MKLTIKVKNLGSTELPKIIEKGDWVDLRVAETVDLKAPQASVLKRVKAAGVENSYRNVTFDTALIPLGVAMKLPKGFEAVILPRSSTFKNFGVIQTNSMGVIDNSYCGNMDEWKYPVIALKNTTINKDSRICQFKIQLSQKATIWQKIKWLLSSNIKFVEVKDLGNNIRGGFGVTGVE